MNKLKLNQAIKFIENQIDNPSKGLPEEVFLFLSRLTPMVNVDLLIKNEQGGTLLAWRDDQYAGAGWHIPGGIIRYKEDMKTRIKKTIKTEIGLPVKFEPVPIAINQLIHKNHQNRAHFISLLFKCFLSNKYIIKNKNITSKDNGYLAWHKSCPKNLIKVHKLYKSYI